MFEKKIRSNPDVVWERVLAPLAVVAAENRLPCVSCVGKVFESILGDQFQEEFLFEECWSDGLKKRGSRVSGWPPNGKNNPVKRRYAVYRLRADCVRCKKLSQTADVDLGGVCFLCLSSQGSNVPPGEDFGEVEQDIRSFIAGLCQ